MFLRENCLFKSILLKIIKYRQEHSISTSMTGKELSFEQYVVGQFARILPFRYQKLVNETFLVFSSLLSVTFTIEQ